MQKFKVIKTTTFEELRDQACLFWDLKDKDKPDKPDKRFKLILPNMHDVMTLNGQKEHPAHTIAKYFEIHRSKKQILHLVIPS